MNSHLAYIGCYTGPGKGEGISSCRQDPESGALTLLETLREVASPSFLCFSRDRRFLFAVNEEGEIGGASSFRIEDGGKLTFLSRQSSMGGSPCHLCTDPAGRSLFVANHNDGSTAVFPIAADGRLSEVSDVQRKEGGHAHWVGFDPTGQLLLAVDKGNDRVWIYRPSEGKLRAHEPAFSELNKGSGPRHLAFHPNGHFAYVNGEKDMSLTVLAYDGEPGRFTPLQRVSTLPAGGAGRGFTTAEVAVHPSGKWLYVSNRGHNSVAAFGIGSDGKVEVLGHVNVGKNPRHIALDPKARFLYVSCQDDHRIEAYGLKENGTLSAEMASRLDTGAPVCLLFADRD